LMNLRYEKGHVERIVREVSTMSLGIRGIEESWLYQEYYQKGWAEGYAEAMAKGYTEARLEQARVNVLLVGRKKFGPPSEAVSDQIAKIKNRERLAALLVRILDVSSWDALLAPGA
jgi:hypothetical protein